MIRRSLFALALLAAAPGCRAERAKVAPNPEVYAWILNGDASSDHVGNVERAGESLLALGVPASHLFVASEPTKLEARVPKSNTGLADRQTLALQLDLLEGRVDSHDLLLVYLTGHGVASDNDARTDTRLALRRGLRMRASWLLEQIRDRLRAPRIFLVTDACYGGGFVLTFHQGTEGEFAGVSPTDESHTTYCQPFAPLFWDGLEGLSVPEIERVALSASQGCSTFRKWKRCMHAPKGCPTYGTFRTHRFRHPRTRRRNSRRSQRKTVPSLAESRTADSDRA